MSLDLDQESPNRAGAPNGPLAQQGGKVAAAAADQAGVSAAGSGGTGSTPPGSRSASAGSKMMAVRVQMLDDSVTLFQVQVRVRLHYVTDETMQCQRHDKLINELGTLKTKSGGGILGECRMGSLS